MSSPSVIYKAYETAPSAIRLNNAKKLVLHSPEVTGCAIPFLALWSLLVLSIAVYCPLSPGCLPDDAPWWLTLALYGMGLVGVLCLIGVTRTNKVITFDFQRKRFIRRYCPEGRSRFVTQELPFSQFRQLSVEFEKARFSDDSDTWRVRLHPESGEPLLILSSSQEETAFRVVRKVARQLNLPVSDPEQIFPEERKTLSRESSGIRQPSPQSRRGFRMNILSSETVMEQRELGRGFASVFLLVFTLIWWGGILLGLAAVVEDIGGGIEQANIPGILFVTVIGLVFPAFGLLLLALTLWLFWGSHVLHLQRGQVTIEERLFGKTLHKKSVPTASIVKIVLISEEQTAHSLKIYSSYEDTVLTYGRGLTLPELTWIQQELDRH